MGRSGSGKSTSFKHALNYLALAAGMRFHHLIVVAAPTRTRVSVAFVVCCLLFVVCFPFGRRLRAVGCCWLAQFAPCHTKMQSAFDWLICIVGQEMQLQLVKPPIRFHCEIYDPKREKSNENVNCQDTY